MSWAQRGVMNVVIERVEADQGQVKQTPDWPSAFIHRFGNFYPVNITSP